jgi:tight adherence protein C
MADDGTFIWVVFLMVSSLAALVCLLVSGRRSRLDQRLGELTAKGGEQAANTDRVAQLARSALPKMGAPLVPKDQEERSRLQARLLHAGLYNRQAMVLFLGVKMLLMIAPPVLGLVAGTLGLLPLVNALIYGIFLGAFGMVAPSFWLDRRKAARQTIFRRSLPDAMDVLVICLEGGLSPPAALRRVAGELRTAHPLLASELNIVQREMQLGRTTGEALRAFGERCDLEEVRSLASVVGQAERFGASLVNALRVHAESLRNKRVQYAEEMAQKASIKMLFPTLFFIFPGIFIVILGPAAIQIMEMLSRLNK